MPSTITILGLGYGDPESRSLAAQRALDNATRVVLRTAVHEGIADLAGDQRVVSCDDIYENAPSFDLVYARIVDRVLDYAREGDVVYAVPGSPVFGERTIDELSSVAASRGHKVAICPSVSGLDAVAAAVGLDILADQLQIVDAAWLQKLANAEPFSGGLLGIDPSRPVVIGQVFDSRTAGDVKHVLSRVFPEDLEIAIVSAAGVTGRHAVARVPLSQLDHGAVDHLTSVVVFPQQELEAARSPATLHRIIGTLRSDHGCPWDRKQTHLTLKDKIIEEAHEAAEAIDSGDPADIAGELGDLLLLVALHAQIAEESGTFTIEDVYEKVNAKLVRRHPHVFGNAVAETPEDVLTTWSSVKQREDEGRDKERSGHRFDQLPRSLSVIQRIKQAEAFHESPDGGRSAAIGDALFALVQQALDRGIDPEPALEQAYRRSWDRTTETEQHAQEGIAE